jgi:hypothetical protein
MSCGCGGKTTIVTVSPAEVTKSQAEVARDAADQTRRLQENAIRNARH